MFRLKMKPSSGVKLKEVKNNLDGKVNVCIDIFLRLVRYSGMVDRIRLCVFHRQFIFVLSFPVSIFLKYFNSAKKANFCIGQLSLLGSDSLEGQRNYIQVFDHPNLYSYALICYFSSPSLCSCRRFDRLIRLFLYTDNHC